MRHTSRKIGVGVLLFLGVGLAQARAETIELVTYYPAPGGGETCVEGLKVGTAYCPVDVDDGEAIFVGPVGIGTNLPAAGVALHVNGTIRSDSNRTIINGFDPGVNLHWIKTAGVVEANSVFMAFKGTADGAAEGVRIAPQNQLGLYVDNTGRVGIGTDAPASTPGLKLHVNGIVQSDGVRTILNGFDGANYHWLRTVGNEPGAVFFIGLQRTAAGAAEGVFIAPGTGTSGLYVNNVGNVGIGTNNPAVRLDVVQNGAVRVGSAYLSSGDNPIPLAHFASNAWYDGSGNWQIPNPARASGLIQYQDSDLYFYQRAAGAGVNAWDTRMALRAGGNVGIGISNPDALLTLAGASGNAAGWLRLRDQFGNSRSLYMTSNNDTLGFWCPHNIAFLSNAGVWQDASDRAYKKEITALRYGLNELLQLKPRQYRMKSDNTPQVGFVGQEVREVIPEVVSGEEGHLGLSYGQMVPVVVKAVQEQQKVIEEQQKRIQALEKALSASQKETR